MKYRRAISLILAGQIIAAPAAQAASLSLKYGGGEDLLTSISPAQNVLRSAINGEEGDGTTPAPTLPPITLPTTQVETTEKLTPTPTQEITPAPVTTPTPTSSPTPVTPPTPSAVPTQKPSTTPGVTPSPQPTPPRETTSTPAPTPAPVETEQTTPAPGEGETTPTPSPTAEPGTTPVPTDEPEASPSASPGLGEGTDVDGGEPSPVPSAPSAEDTDAVMDDIFLLQTNEALMPLADEASRLPQMVYIGFGYEVYQADKAFVKDTYLWGPESDNTTVRQASDTTARLAVEKSVAKPSDDYRGTQGYVYDTAYTYWKPREDGLYYAADLQIRDTNLRKLLGLNDYKSYLGRIPDYEFEDWYLSAAGPMNKADTPYLSEGGGTNRYASGEDETVETGKSQFFLTPLYYTDLELLDGKKREDLRLSDEGLTWEDINATIVDTMEEKDEHFKSINQTGNNAAAAMYYSFYYGMEQAAGFKVNDDMPIIAHWQLSDNARLVKTAAVNANPTTDRTTEKTTIYPVKNGVVQTDVDLLSDMYDQPLDNNTKQKVTLDTDVDSTEYEFSYYLRVNNDVDAIDPTFLAYEPYYSTEITGEDNVLIQLRPAGKTSYDTIELNGHEILNAPRENGENLDLYNCVEYPMRSKWTTSANIPLTLAQPIGDTDSLSADEIAEKKLTNYYNEVKVTVTAPDGTTKTVYTFYIQRLNNPEMIQNPGNTPFGMIANDPRPNTGDDSFDKGAARSRFEMGYSLGNGTYARALADPTYSGAIPVSQIPRVGKNYEYQYAYQFFNGDPTTGGQAQSGAWHRTVYNVDLDENAIIVYQDSAFVDPGFTIKDSLGETVTISGGDNVQRSIIFRTSQFDTGISTSELRREKPSDSVSGGTFQLFEKWKYFTGAKSVGNTDAPADSKDVKAETFLPVRSEGGKDVIDLRGLQIIPGIYQIQYQFTDSLSNITYNASTEDKFVGEAADREALAKGFTRTLVVLPMPGDVDMDGAVTAADAEVLSRALRDKDKTIATAGISDILFLTSDYAGPIQSLFMYRVCDANNDGIVDEKDVICLRSGFNPQTVPNVVEYAYIPLDSTVDTEHERQSVKDQKIDYSDPQYAKGKLTLDYLGKNTPEISADPTKLDGLSTEDTLQVGDVFWVGVRVSGLEGLPTPGKEDTDQTAKAAILGNIQSMMLSIAYDNRYLEPAILIDTSTGDAESDWLKTIQRYNFSENDTSVANRYHWPKGYALVDEGSHREGDYGKPNAIHSSKAILEAEEGSGKWPVSDGATTVPGIRQLTVALHTEGASNGRVLYGKDSDQEGNGGDQYLLRIPFVLHHQPQDAETLYGLDLALGMREFNILSALVPQDTQRPQTTAAWSSDKVDIFGGTWNLADELYYDYNDSSARALPLGEDNQDRIILANTENGGKTVYGDHYSHFERDLQGLSQADMASIQAHLPKGLTLDLNGAGQLSSGYITGTPEEVGTFNFQVDGSTVRLYSIVVEKAPLAVAAIPQSIYYGETYAPLDYVYKPDDIKPLDRERSGFDYSSGSSEMLSKLPGLVSPALSTKYTKGNDAGEYTITLSAQMSGEGEDATPISGLTNYRFLYASATVDEQGKVTVGESTDKATSADSVLEVKKRPLKIEKINDPAMAAVSIFVRDPQTYFSNLTASYQNMDDTDVQEDFTLIGLTDSGYPAGLTGTPVYGEDKVGIVFTAVLKEHDNDAPPYYNIPQGQNEGRVDATISDVKLDAASSKNYVLLGLQNNIAQGTIKAYSVTDIAQVVLPANTAKLTYTFGEKLSFDLIDVIFRYSDDTAHHTQYRNPTSFQYDGIVVTFVTMDELKAGNAHRDDSDRILNHGDTMIHSIHDGMYLCFSVVSYDVDEHNQPVTKTLTWPKWDADWKNEDGTTGAWLKWVKESETEPGVWVADEAPKPLTVLKKPIVLNVATGVNSDTNTIYYGEYYDRGDGKENPDGFRPDFTYELTSPEGATWGLAEEDVQAILQAWNAKYPDREKTVLEGTSEELELLEGYKAPKLWAVTNQEQPDDPNARVTQKTNVGDYYIFISDDEKGADGKTTGATNYTFYYRGTVAPGNDGANPGIGAHYVRALKIIPRPIVVDSLTMQKVTGADVIDNSDPSEVFLYDDTRVLTLEGMRYTNSESGQMETKYVTAKGTNAASAEAGGSDTFVAKLPTGNDGNSYVDPDHLNTFTKLANTLSGPAILDGDEVVIRYVANYLDQVPSASPPSSTHFPMNVGPNGSIVTQKVVDAGISSLSLPENEGQNRNYVIVYDSNSTASMRQPLTSRAKGLVKLRPISSLEVTKAPNKVNYTYGEALNLSGMELELTYQPEGDNALKGENNRVITRTISDRDVAGQGLELYWIVGEDPRLSDGTQLTPDIIEALLNANVLRPIADNSSYPDVTKSGKNVLVCGRRYSGSGAEDAGHIIVQGVLDWAENFVVTPKEIALTVEPKYRYYGEPNATPEDPFRAYFLNRALASPDQKLLEKEGISPDGGGRFYVAANSLDRDESTDTMDMSTAVTSHALDEINQPFSGETTANIGLVFTTDGVQGADVGQYAIDMASMADGNLKNYTFHVVPSAVRVFRRPIVINEILQDPVSTIFYNTEETEFPATVSQTGNSTTTKVGFSANLPTAGMTATGRYSNTGRAPNTYTDGDRALFDLANSGVGTELPLTGNAIYDNDQLTLSMVVVFPAVGDRKPFDPDYTSAVQRPQDVTIKTLALATGEKEKNYFLVYDLGADKANQSPKVHGAMGQLDRRPITAIKVTQVPKMEYTYPETLNLSQLKVDVTYKQLTLSDDGIESAGGTENLTYSQLSGRLNVNYYSDSSLPSYNLDSDAGQQAIRNLVSTHPADSGDHLTIAPSHEARFEIRDDNGDGTGQHIAHNGMYLVLTARADRSMKYEAQPVLVGTVATGPIALKVNPLDLTYDLTAQNKTYNDPDYAGRASAAGAITLTNPYTTTLNGNADRDLIYVATDVANTDYGNQTTLSDYMNDSDKSDAEVYTFRSTGHSAVSGQAQFYFYDENVKYYDDVYTADNPVSAAEWVGYWQENEASPKTPQNAEEWDGWGDVAPMPVLVKDLHLAGPDAANYTLDSWIGSHDDVAANEASAKPDGKPNNDKATPAYASIGKARQSITSLEKPLLSVDAHSNAVRVDYSTALPTDSGDQFRSEAHYEYGLAYLVSADTDLIPIASTASGTLIQWGGTDSWSDLPYYGGEKYEVTWPEGYEPSDRDQSGSNTEERYTKGQNYQWAQDEAANWSAPAYDGYRFGEREGLARDGIYWGMVRLAETHNYLPSAYVVAADTGIVALEEQISTARSDAEEMSRRVGEWATTKPTESTDTAPLLGPAEAVKTYKQSFEVRSTEEKSGTDGEKYDIDTLEAVWFTDIQAYEKKENLDAVLRNQAVIRYHGYYWDQEQSAQVEFDKNGSAGLDLTGPLTVTVKEKGENGADTEVERQVNLDSHAILYASTRSGGGGSLYPDEIEIVVPGGSGGGETPGGEGENVFILGGKPIQLEVKITPAYALSEGLDWTSSDPRVVIVNENGELFFWGVGTVTITARTKISHRTATVTITVTDPQGLAQGIGAGWEAALKLANREDNSFNFYYTEPFFELDGDYQFHPGWLMDRAEVVSVLEKFYTEAIEPAAKAQSFPDLTGEESYAPAANRLTQGGVIVGLPAGIFGGEYVATRAEAATVLCRMMGLEPIERPLGKQSFRDLEIQVPVILEPETEGGEPVIETYTRIHWASGYINALAEAGVTLGTGEGYFNPDRPITRAELAAMLGRVLLTGVYYGGEEIVPTDVDTNHWARNLIIRSVNNVEARTK